MIIDIKDIPVVPAHSSMIIGNEMVFDEPIILGGNHHALIGNQGPAASIKIVCEIVTTKNGEYKEAGEIIVPVSQTTLTTMDLPLTAVYKLRFVAHNDTDETATVIIFLS
ncbi:hypothetical protein [Enterobacter asburiae]|uniref:hypothetical protein n=1 Tax=Enterobacter asburiae TaxID=61645 RepID=UPI0011D206F3|nr:hypothetical protein [Enterobacter asburiae]